MVKKNSTYKKRNELTAAEKEEKKRARSWYTKLGSFTFKFLIAAAALFVLSVLVVGILGLVGVVAGGFVGASMGVLGGFAGSAVGSGIANASVAFWQWGATQAVASTFVGAATAMGAEGAVAHAMGGVIAATASYIFAKGWLATKRHYSPEAREAREDKQEEKIGHAKKAAELKLQNKLNKFKAKEYRKLAKEVSSGKDDEKLTELITKHNEELIDYLTGPARAAQPSSVAAAPQQVAVP